MSKPYRFTGDETVTYTTHGLGDVKPGAVAYFEFQAPDSRWEEVTADTEPEDKPARSAGKGRRPRGDA